MNPNFVISSKYRSDFIHKPFALEDAVYFIMLVKFPPNFQTLLQRKKSLNSLK